MKRFLDSLALVLLIIGGLNWGLWGFREVDMVAYLFGATSLVAKVIYGLVGLSAIYALSFLTRCMKK